VLATGHWLQAADDAAAAAAIAAAATVQKLHHHYCRFARWQIARNKKAALGHKLH